MAVIVRPYPVAGPYMDAGSSPFRIKPGYLSRVVGIDGRFVGALRPYPGMLRLMDLNEIRTVNTPISFFRYVSALRGNTANTLRGFVVRAVHAATVKLMFFYYDSSTSLWAVTDFEATGALAGVELDVTTYGKYIYVAARGVAGWPKVFYHNGTSWQSAAVGPTYDDDENAAPVLVEGAGGVLVEGTFDVVYRFYDSRRAVYSGISERTRITTTAANKKISVTITKPGTGSTNFDTLEVLRTISVEVAGSTFQAGILYPEQTAAITWPDGGGTQQTIDVGLITDEALVENRGHEPWEDAVGDPPNSGAILYYQDALFMGQDPSTNTGAGIRWSSVNPMNIGGYNKESFNTEHAHNGRLDDGYIKRFVEAGDLVYGVSDAVVNRIRKVGTQISVFRLHFGRGTTSAEAMHAVGEDVFLMTQLGIGLIAANSGDLQLFTSLDRIVQGTWKSTLDDVVSAYDSPTGASYFLNTSLEEAIVIWHVTKAATILDDMTFVGATTGTHPEDGGPPRAFFLDAYGIICYPDAAAEGTRTMRGITAGMTLGGTATDGTYDFPYDILVDDTATFDDSMVGSKLYMWDVSAGVWHCATILATFKGTHLYWDPTECDFYPAEGDIYSISPVVIKLRFPPLPPDKETATETGRRIAKAVNITAFNMTGVTGNPAARWEASHYLDLADTLETGARWSGTMADGVVSVHTPLAGVMVEPTIECYAAGVYFELTGMEVVTTMTSSRNA